MEHDGFSGDEILLFFVSAVAAAGVTAGWARTLAGAGRVPGRRRRGPRVVLLITPVVCLAILWAVLAAWSAGVVRGSPGYQALFACVGVAVLGLSTWVSSVTGIGTAREVVGRGDDASAVALAGAMLGATLAYSGANVGEGATVWMTIGPAALGLAAWAAVWIGIEALSGASEAIAIERDLASGWRMAGALVASGLILGRAVAGAYESAAATVRDLVTIGWPAALVAVATVAMQRAWRRAGAGWLWAGVTPAVGLAALAVGYVVWLGRWR
ncbi:MAG TPA: hypothetical protein VEA69_14400 [Tepidisphaeraceae bacterium]|nr:hypothetical protein [Tepidisphaeraceae bacterium]